MFKNVIVRRPCKAMVEGITSAPELGKPDYELALKQHDTYIEALKKCGVEVTVLEADERYPDSCFVEDPAVITRKCAIKMCIRDRWCPIRRHSHPHWHIHHTRCRDNPLYSGRS